MNAEITDKKGVMIGEAMDRAMESLLNSNTALWVKVIAAAFYGVLSFFVPIAPFLFLAFGLIVMDFITGIAASYILLQRKKRKGEQVGIDDLIRSRRMMDTLAKILLFFCVITAAHGFSEVFMPYFIDYVGVHFPLTMIVAGIITATELRSISENYQKVTGVDLWGAVFRFLPEKLRQLFKK